VMMAALDSCFMDGIAGISLGVAPARAWQSRQAATPAAFGSLLKRSAVRVVLLSGPSGLQRGVFSQVGSRLCGMMTLDAGNRACAVDTVLAAVVADMIEGHLAEFCVLSENNNVRYFRYILLRFMRQAAA